VVRGGISFHIGAEDLKAELFSKFNFGGTFTSLLYTAKKRLVGPYWMTHREQLYNASRQTPPAYDLPM
jgi:hypothetical protein